MSYKESKKYYKRIYIGTGPIMILDAINYNLSNKSVIMIDKSDQIGGAWKHIKFCNVDKLENAVHYLLPNEECYYFLEEFLKIKLRGSDKKFFNMRFLNFRFNFPVKNIFSKIYFNFININNKSLLNLPFIIKSIFSTSKIDKSKYPANGSLELISRIKKIAEESNLNFLMGKEIKSIKVLDNKVYILVNEELYTTDELIISHGFLPPKQFHINGQEIKIRGLKSLRGSLHINTQISSFKKFRKFKNKFSQIIFPKDSIVKYIHNLSQFINDKDFSKNYKFIVVAAVKNEVKKSEEVIREVIKLLEVSRLIPKSNNRRREDLFWQDIYLPILLNKDLEKINKISNNIIRIMYTDELSKGIAIYSKNWKFLKEFCKKDL